MRRHLHAEGRVSSSVWRASRLHATIRPGDWPEWVREVVASGSIPIACDPADITVVLAGADLAIPQHAYFPSWGHPPCRITREIELPAEWRARLGAG
jgi:hypothetical protein